MASPTEVARHILAREKAELEERYREDEGQPEVCFIEEALKSLAEREQDTMMMATFMDGGGGAECELEEPREEEECVEQTMLNNTDGTVVAEDPFADEDSDTTVPTRHLSTSSEGSIEIGVGEEVIMIIHVV